MKRKNHHHQSLEPQLFVPLSVGYKEPDASILSLYYNPLAEQVFPEDPETVLIIEYQKNVYSIGKYVLKWSEYLQDVANLNDKPSPYIINLKHSNNQEAFDLSMKILFGFKDVAIPNYHAIDVYAILHELRVKGNNDFMKKLDLIILKNLNEITLFNTYDLGINFNKKLIIDECLRFLKERKYQDLMTNRVNVLNEANFKTLLNHLNYMKNHINNDYIYLNDYIIDNLIRTYYTSKYPNKITKIEKDSNNQFKIYINRNIEDNPSLIDISLIVNDGNTNKSASPLPSLIKNKDLSSIIEGHKDELLKDKLTTFERQNDKLLIENKRLRDQLKSLLDENSKLRTYGNDANPRFIDGFLRLEEKMNVILDKVDLINNENINIKNQIVDLTTKYDTIVETINKKIENECISLYSRLVDTKYFADKTEAIKLDQIPSHNPKTYFSTLANHPNYLNSPNHPDTNFPSRRSITPNQFLRRNSHDFIIKSSNPNLSNTFSKNTNANGTIVNKPYSMINEPYSIMNKPSSMINEPYSTINRPNSMVNGANSTANGPNSTINRPNSMVNEPNSMETMSRTIEKSANSTYGIFDGFDSISSIITGGSIKRIDEWIRKNNMPGVNLSMRTFVLKLLYRGSRDGFMSSVFHKKCDKKAPTVTFVRSKLSLRVFGGYTEAVWDEGQEGYIPDKNAFLFSCTINEKFPCIDPLTAIHNQTGYMVRFGGKDGLECDLAIGDDCNESMNNYSNFPCSFSNSGSSIRNEDNKALLAGTAKFLVDDIEVYLVRYT